MFIREALGLYGQGIKEVRRFVYRKSSYSESIQIWFPHSIITDSSEGADGLLWDRTPVFGHFSILVG